MIVSSTSRVLSLLVAVAAFAGCRGYGEKSAEFRAAYGAAEFARANAAVDELIEDEAADEQLLLLEKGMATLAAGDPDSAIDVLRRARDGLDAHFQEDALDWVSAVLGDDASREYAGADYEHVLVRVVLALCDLLADGGDAYAYAIQVGETQERILGSEFGAAQDYKPREHYRRVAIGAYLEGLVLEEQNAPREAGRAYARAIEYGGETPLLAAALNRALFGRYAAPEHGVVHVFVLAGRGPSLVEGVHAPTTLANQLAGLVLALLTSRASPLVQAPVRVPVVEVRDARPHAPIVKAPGQPPVACGVLLDVNRVAIEQLEANLPWIMARALIRRAWKGTLAFVLERSIDRRNDSGLAFLIAALLSLAATEAERADTRSWTSLPAQFQAARLELPAGVHDLAIDGSTVPLRVAAGHASFVVVIRPAAHRPGVLLVDDWSALRRAE